MLQVCFKVKYTYRLLQPCFKYVSMHNTGLVKWGVNGNVWALKLFSLVKDKVNLAQAMLGSALAWLRLSWMLPALHRTASFRLNPMLVCFVHISSSWVVMKTPNSFINISSSWVEISLHTEFQLARLPGSRTASFRLSFVLWGVTPILLFIFLLF